MPDAVDSAGAARAAFRSGAASAEEIAREMLARVEMENPRLQAFREVLAETALAEARVADAAWARGHDPGPLAGVCVAVKENIDCVPAEASAGMRALIGRRPTRDAPVVARLRALGATILGTTVSDPGGLGVRTAEVVHPVDPLLSVGGSSGGSAAALAAGLCHVALGTDTGGSIRIPAALCGVAGLKPTYGRWSLDGVWPLVPSLDHVGPMAGDASGLVLAYDAVDGTAAQEPWEPPRLAFDPRWVEACAPEVQARFQDALALLRADGALVREVALPDLGLVRRVHSTIFLVEATARYRAAFPPDADLPEAAKVSLRESLRLSTEDYFDACRVRRQLSASIDAIVEGGDLIVSPTVISERVPKTTEEFTVGDEVIDFTYGLVRLTCLYDHTGHPAASMPIAGCSLQVVARRNDDRRALALARYGR